MKREYGYDCLRVYAMFMVILNHIADRYVLFTKETPFYEGIYLCEGISHCAVPIFLMLTGAFLIEKMPTISAKQFYINSFKKIGIPTIFFALCIGYTIFKEGSMIYMSCGLP